MAASRFSWSPGLFSLPFRARCCPCCWNGFIPSGAGRLKVICGTIRGNNVVPVAMLLLAGAASAWPVLLPALLILLTLETIVLLFMCWRGQKWPSRKGVWTQWSGEWAPVAVLTVLLLRFWWGAEWLTASGPAALPCLSELYYIQAKRTVFIRCNSFIFPGFSYEITEVVKSNRKCDIWNRCFRFWKHFTGFFYSVFIDKTDWCLSNFLFKIVAEIIRTHKAYFGQYLQSYGFCIIDVNIFNHLF